MSSPATGKPTWCWVGGSQTAQQWLAVFVDSPETVQPIVYRDLIPCVEGVEGAALQT